jgi:hypothetical protein
MGKRISMEAVIARIDYPGIHQLTQIIKVAR